VPIVSGGARGIDGEAHRVALHEDGLTFCVLGCGVDVVYPANTANFLLKLLKRARLFRSFFRAEAATSFLSARNRIISGICHAVLVTEASKASGTLITAGLLQIRDVMFVQYRDRLLRVQVTVAIS